jgi:hypothetical protein
VSSASNEDRAALPPTPLAIACDPTPASQAVGSVQVAFVPSLERTWTGNATDGAGPSPDVEALCALLARANRRITTERRTGCASLQVVQ